MEYEGYRKSDENKALTSSEGMLHDTGMDDFSAGKKPMHGYEPHPEDKNSEAEPSELVNISSSYNNISVGSSQNGIMTIAMSAKRRHDSTSLDGDRKVLRGSRKRRRASYFGEYMTNSRKPSESAFAYRVSKNVSEVRMLDEMRQRTTQNGLETAMEAAPFLTLEKDTEELRLLREDNSKGRANKEDVTALERAVNDKKILECRFLRRLKLARLKAVKLDDNIKSGIIYKSLLELDTEGDEDNGSDDIGESEASSNSKTKNKKNK